MTCSRDQTLKLIADLWAALEHAGIARPGALAASDPKLHQNADAERGRRVIGAWLAPQKGSRQ
jgi:hypothetical protein